MSQVPADVKQGIDLLLNQLLPTVVTKIKTLETEVAALKSELETLKAAPAPAPKRKRTTKKGNPDGSVVEKPSKDGKVDFAITSEQDAAIRELYQQTVGVPLENMEILTDADGNNLTVNFAPVTVEVVDVIAFLLPDPEEFVYAGLERDRAQSKSRKFLLEVIAVDHAEDLLCVGGFVGISPAGSHLLSFRGKTVVQHVLAHIDEKCIGFTHCGLLLYEINSMAPIDRQRQTLMSHVRP